MDGAKASTSGTITTMSRGASRPRAAEGERGRVAALVASVAVLALAWQLALMPVVNRFKSGRYFAQEARPFLDAADEVYLYEKALSGMYNLWTGRLVLPVLPEPEDAKRALAGPRRVALIVAKRSQVSIEDLTGQIRGHAVAQEGVGGRIVLLLTNWEPAASR